MVRQQFEEFLIVENQALLGVPQSESYGKRFDGIPQPGFWLEGWG